MPPAADLPGSVDEHASLRYQQSTVLSLIGAGHCRRVFFKFFELESLSG